MSLLFFSVSLSYSLSHSILARSRTLLANWHSSALASILLAYSQSYSSRFSLTLYFYMYIGYANSRFDTHINSRSSRLLASALSCYLTLSLPLSRTFSFLSNYYYYHRDSFLRICRPFIFCLPHRTFLFHFLFLFFIHRNHHFLHHHLLLLLNLRFLIFSKCNRDLL